MPDKIEADRDRGPQAVVLYGASGHALGWRDLFLTVARPIEVVAYIDDFRGDQGVRIDGAPVLTLEAWRAQFPNVPCTITVGDPRARRLLASKVRKAGGSFRSLYEIAGWISPNITIGEGSIVAPSPTYIGPGTKIGHQSMIMALCTVAHDCAIGDYVTICPSVNISGYVHVEDDVFIGVGTTIVNGSESNPLRIGRGAVICAGSVVLQPIPAGAKVAGNPAEDLRSLLKQRAGRRRYGVRDQTSGVE